jgi:hypothetical protein
MVALKDFTLAPRCMAALIPHIDVLTLWLDREADESIVAATLAVVPSSLRVRRIKATVKWGRWNWREALLRSLDDVQPAYVLQPDSDEMFGEGFADEFARFRKSGADLMMMRAQMVTADARPIPLYPAARHCKVFRWLPGLRFQPYRGYARPTWPAGVEPRAWAAETPFLHLCHFTRDLQRRKILHR